MLTLDKVRNTKPGRKGRKAKPLSPAEVAFIHEIRNRIPNRGRTTIAKRTKLSKQYVSDVLMGRRWCNKILQAAVDLLVENGMVKPIDVSLHRQHLKAQ